MKTPAFCSFPLTRTFSFAVGIGCALALTPLGVSAQEADAAKEQAAQPQPGDPVASKAGEINKAEPGGAKKLSAKETLLVKTFGAGNAAEIKMGELALKNAESQDVKDFAQMMITDHSKANEQLGVVAKNHNIDFPPDAPEKEKALGKKMLDVKGAAFDKAYVMHAVKDHTEDVAEYKKAKGEVKDKMLKEYVDQTETIVAGHLKMAKELEAKMTAKKS